MGKPAVPIEVEDATGRWYVDGLPMMLIPQHFFLNNHYAIEAELGTERLNEILAPAGHLSAYVWCEHEAKQHGLSGEDVFRHYMKRLSQRGWAQFEVLAVDGKTGRAQVKVTQSIFVTGRHGGGPRKLCGMFAPWMHGALEYVAKASGGPSRLVAREVYCQGEGEQDHCLFEVAPEPAT